MQQVQDKLNFAIETPSDAELKRRFHEEQKQKREDLALGDLVPPREGKNWNEHPSTPARANRKAKRKAAKMARRRARV